MLDSDWLDRTIGIVLYGSSCWKEIINFDALVRHGMISPEDLGLFEYADEPAAALRILQSDSSAELDTSVPDFARVALRKRMSQRALYANIARRR